MEVVIDAEGAIIGRLGTFVAKQALIGNEVRILNCEKGIITGSKEALQAVYLSRKWRGGYAQKGPYFSKSPEKIVKRSFRGMLPWKTTRGKDAFKRIKCYSGVPEEFEKKEKKEFKRTLKKPYLTVKEVSKLM
ncbi:50S ribosomal protein L13 [Nanoarchaeota archaeon]